MALSLITSPPSPLAAWGPPEEWVVETDDSTVGLIKATITEGGTTRGVQYAQVINDQATFNFRGLWASIMYEWNNPITSHTGVVSTAPQDLDVKMIDVNFVEVGPVFPGNTGTTRNLWRTRDTGRDVYWDRNASSDFFVPFLNSVGTPLASDSRPHRPIFQNQIIPVTFVGKNSDSNLWMRWSQPTEYQIGSLGNFRECVTLRNDVDGDWSIGWTKDLDLKDTRVLDLHTVPKGEHTEILYFRNKWSGWDWSLWTDVERSIGSKSTTHSFNTTVGGNQYSTEIENVWEDKKLTPIAWPERYWLRDLWTSPVILDSTGTRVVLITNGGTVESPDFSDDSVTIRKWDDWIMNY